MSIKIKMSEILFQIPKIIAVDILCGWLETNDLTKVDSAICNFEIRKLFIKLVMFPAFKIIELEIVSVDFLKWIQFRQIYLNGIHLCGIKDNSIFSLETPIYNLLQKVQTLSLSNFSESMMSIESLLSIVNPCYFLTSLTTHKIDVIDSSFYTHLIDQTILINLKELSIGVGKLESVNLGLEHISTHCNQLKLLRFTSKISIIWKDLIYAIIIVNPLLETIELFCTMECGPLILQSVSKYCPQLKNLIVGFYQQTLNRSEQQHMLLFIRQCKNLLKFKIARVFEYRRLPNGAYAIFAEHITHGGHTNMTTEFALDCICLSQMFMEGPNIEKLHLNEINDDLCKRLSGHCRFLHTLTFGCVFQNMRMFQPTEFLFDFLNTCPKLRNYHFAIPKHFLLETITKINKIETLEIMIECTYDEILNIIKIKPHIKEISIMLNTFRKGVSTFEKEGLTIKDFGDLISKYHSGVNLKTKTMQDYFHEFEMT
jgi:hypothetical protein